MSRKKKQFVFIGFLRKCCIVSIQVHITDAGSWVLALGKNISTQIIYASKKHEEEEEEGEKTKM